ncbi:MAG: RhuM family protein [Campylobacterota bacterium]|nr:RhuM family protein [Campylobacterota bacterium]
MNDDNVVLYNDGEIELNVSINDETTWLNRNQISQLLDRDVKTIGKHINNIFKEKELEKNAVVANFATTAKDGKKYDVEYYNLDVIISIGYRVKSQRGVKFRQWATKVLKSYITDGYAINSDKITNDRFVSLENKVNLISSKLNNMSDSLEDNTLQPKQQIFFNGQVFDAHSFISDLIRTAKSSIVLIDNYIDDTTLTLFSKVPDIKVSIYTHTISKQLKLDLTKYNKQYSNITIKTFKDSHDRFMIIDNQEVYLIGASLKDLGKKWFGFSRLDISLLDVMLKKLPNYTLYK